MHKGLILIHMEECGISVVPYAHIHTLSHRMDLLKAFLMFKTTHNIKPPLDASYLENSTGSPCQQLPKRKTAVVHTELHIPTQYFSAAASKIF